MNSPESQVISKPIVSKIQVKLPDGSFRDFPSGTTALDVANSISPRLAAASVVAKIKPLTASVAAQEAKETADTPAEAEMYSSANPSAERLVDLHEPIREDVELQLLTRERCGVTQGGSPLGGACDGDGGAGAFFGDQAGPWSGD